MTVVIRVRQLWLPSLKIEKLVVKKYPQPRQLKFNFPKKFELLHHPFDLGFRGRLNKWLILLKKEQNLDFEKFLSDEEINLVELYFYPQASNKRWLNQENVLKKVKIATKKKLKKLLVETLIKIWSELKAD